MSANDGIRKYRPDNGIESLAFMDVYCHRCSKDNPPKDGCSILARAFDHDIDDDRYPTEWRYNEGGRVLCTEFSEASVNCDGDGE